MTEAQIQLQNALTTTFLANLAFLSEYDNELYHRVDELSRMIENGTYKEKYALEFIMESGDFDIYDLVNNKYLYNKNPKKMNDEFVRKIQFDNNNCIYVMEEKYFSLKKKIDINKGDRFDYNALVEFFSSTHNEMFEYANALTDFLENKKKKFKKIDKFIFLGTLLGRHIPRIAKKVNAESYLVLERNLEIFRLSLFTVDYTILAEKGVVFSIMDKYLDEEKRVQDFIKNDLFNNYMIKFSTTSINIDKYIDTLNTALILINNSSQYTYTRYLYSLANRITKILEKEYNILQMNKIQENLNFFNDLPILYIAAGPSLDENIDWIRANQNKFFIVTIGAAYKKLIANEIKIDMITTLDEDIILEKIQFDDENVSKIDKDTIILASIKTNEKILKKFNQNNLFLYEISIAFFKNNIMFEGYSIGELTLDILLKMNAKKIYLIGLDLALNQETGESHFLGSSSITNKFDLKKDEIKDTFSLDDTVKVKGNFLDEVTTISMFYNSIKALEDIVSEKDIQITIYNLSSHGAYFKNTIPLKTEEININELINIDCRNDYLKDSLHRYSLKKLDEESKKDLEEDIKVLENLLKNFTSTLKNLKIKTYDEFYNKVIELFLSIKVNNKLIIVIFKKYLMMLLPYLSYHFNDIKIKNIDKKINRILDIFESQFKLILEDYIYCIKRVTKK